MTYLSYLLLISKPLISPAHRCVVDKGLVVAALSVDCEITRCLVDKGLVEASLVVVSVATGCVGVEIPSDDVPLSTIAKINLFMNKKVKVQYVTVVNNS